MFHIAHWAREFQKILSGQMASSEPTIRTDLKNEVKKYFRPEILILDEIGYLPISWPGTIR